jgi:hypothetical protein
MTYLQKFNQLIAILYANHLAYGKDVASRHRFETHYQGLDAADPKKAFLPSAVDLNIFINDLSGQLEAREVSDKCAYLSLLAVCAGTSYLPTGHTNLKGEEKTKHDLTATVDQLLATAPNNTIVTDEEKQFAFLCANAELILAPKEYDNILQAAYNDKATLAETNWSFALAIYQHYKKIEKTNQAMEKERMEGVLLGYLKNNTNIVCSDLVKIYANLLPFSIKDYLFYHMTDAALKHAFPEQQHTLLEEMHAMLMQHARQPDLQLKDYNDTMKQGLTPFVAEMNTFYQSLKDDEQKNKVKSFVEGIAKLDASVRTMKSVKQDDDKQRAQITSQITFLRYQAKTLFAQGKASNTVLKILGIGLIVLGLVALGASIALALLLPPVGLAVVGGVTVTTTMVASGASGVGGVVAFGLGVLSLFKSREIKPAKVTTATNHVIDLCEKLGAEALNVAPPAEELPAEELAM